MPNSKQALKRHRQSLVNRNRNRVHSKTMRSQIKNFLASLEGGDKEAAAVVLAETVSRIDVTGKRGIIHKNKANRLKSRLTARFNRAFA